MTQWNERELLRGLRSGRADAIEAFLDLYSDRLLRGAYLLLDDHHAAEDVVQESFLAALKHIKRFRAESGLYTWLYRIMVNECRMYLRKRRPALLAETDRMDTTVDDAEALIHRQEERMTLVSALKQLPYMYREVLVLHYYFDMSLTEIADALGCSPTTIKSRLFRGRRQLGDLIQEVLCHGAL